MVYNKLILTQKGQIIMKLFHLSDLHIGLKLMNRDLTEDQQYILNRIVQYAKEKQPDAIMIAGDIYDKAVPSAEAVSLFDSFVTSLKESVPQSTIMMISGNHDSAPRIDYGPVHFYLLPFVKPSMVKNIIGTNDGRNYSYSETIKKLIEREEMNTKDRNVLISHQFYLPVNKKAEDIERTDSEIRTAGNIDEVSGEVLLPFDYAALGHIHKPMKVGSDVYRYCGTPLPYSMSEAGQDKGIIEIEMKEKGVVETQVLPLKPLHDLRIIEGELKDVLSQSCDDFVRVVLTDKQDLNIFEMQEKLKNAFPRLLEIRRENIRKNNYQAVVKKDVKMDPFSLCTDFLNGVDEEEKDLLQDIINHVKGV